MAKYSSSARKDVKSAMRRRKCPRPVGSAPEGQEGAEASQEVWLAAGVPVQAGHAT
jgi:hypothetical protein